MPKMYVQDYMIPLFSRYVFISCEWLIRDCRNRFWHKWYFDLMLAKVCVWWLASRPTLEGRARVPDTDYSHPHPLAKSNLQNHKRKGKGGQQDSIDHHEGSAAIARGSLCYEFYDKDIKPIWRRTNSRGREISIGFPILLRWRWGRIVHLRVWSTLPGKGEQNLSRTILGWTR